MKMAKLTVFDIIEKHFKDERFKYFQSSDAHRNIEGETYLTYTKNGADRIELYMGGNNGELCLIVTSDAEKLDLIITNLLY